MRSNCSFTKEQVNISLWYIFTSLYIGMQASNLRVARTPILILVPSNLVRRSLLTGKMLVLVLILVMVIRLGLSFLVICSALLRWNEVRYRKKGLPPGTMGWPIVGETTEFLKQGPSFMKNKKLRYGSLFKSHLLGCPTVVSMDPVLNRFILVNEGKGFLPGYPQSMLDILGRSNIAAVHGTLHKTMRSVMLGLVSPPLIRDQLLSKIDEFMRSYVDNWDGRVIDIQEKTKEMALMSALKQIAGIETGPFFEALKKEIFRLVLGTLSLPMNIPGTNYYRGLKARKKVVSMLQWVIDQRRISRCSCPDMLDFLLKNDGNSKAKLEDEQIIDLIIALVYSGYETVSTTSMMAVKYLHDHPKVLEELRNEHFRIQKGEMNSYAIDWANYKSMRVTHAVILETLRMATVVNGVLRKTTKDIEVNGFTIPLGWRIYVYTREINYDPCVYPDPATFNPWRWLDNNMDSHQHFMLFGAGSRMCPGKELGTAEIAVFLHYFVTRYRWEEVGKNHIVKFPRVQAPNGLNIRVWDALKLNCTENSI